MHGFNVGVLVSLGDMELALDYINDKEAFEPELSSYRDERICEQNSNKEIYTDNSINNKDEDGFTDEIEDEDIEFELEDEDEFIEDEDDINEEYEIEQKKIADEQAEYIKEQQRQLELYKKQIEEQQKLEKQRLEKERQLELQRQEVERQRQEIERQRIIREQQKREQELLEQLEKAKSKISELETNKEKDSDRLGEVLDRISKLENNKGSSKSQVQINKQEKQKKESSIVKNTTDVKQVNKVKNRKSKEERQLLYDSMDIESLYANVKRFLIAKGIKNSTLDRSILDDEFKVKNVNRLIMKSYLISIGKRITIGK